MFLFFHEMKNGEDEKEEDIMEERDGNYTHRWKPTNEEMRERRHRNKSEGGTTFFSDLETVTY